MNLREAIFKGIEKRMGPSWEALLRLDETVELRLAFFGGLQTNWVVRIRGEIASQAVDVVLGTMFVARVRDLLTEARGGATWCRKVRVGRGWARIDLTVADLLGEQDFPEMV